MGHQVASFSSLCHSRFGHLPPSVTLIKSFSFPEPAENVKGTCRNVSHHPSQHQTDPWGSWLRPIGQGSHDGFPSWTGIRGRPVWHDRPECTHLLRSAFIVWTRVFTKVCSVWASPSSPRGAKLIYQWFPQTTVLCSCHFSKITDNTHVTGTPLLIRKPGYFNTKWKTTDKAKC